MQDGGVPEATNSDEDEPNGKLIRPMTKHAWHVEQPLRLRRSC